jgi:hypothetical protein
LGVRLYGALVEQVKMLQDGSEKLLVELLEEKHLVQVLVEE